MIIMTNWEKMLKKLEKYNDSISVPVSTSSSISTPVSTFSFNSKTRKKIKGKLKGLRKNIENLENEVKELTAINKITGILENINKKEATLTTEKSDLIDQIKEKMEKVIPEIVSEST